MRASLFVSCLTQHPRSSPVNTQTAWKNEGKKRSSVDWLLCSRYLTSSIDLNRLKWTKPVRSHYVSVIGWCWRLFLIYFTYTCSDIHIISCCDALAPNSGRFIQTVHTHLHSYHARMGRAGRQRSSLWPKQANTQAEKRGKKGTKTKK